MQRWVQARFGDHVDPTAQQILCIQQQSAQGVGQQFGAVGLDQRVHG